MRLGDIIEFRKDLYFEGAVQADWFYDPVKAAKVAESFVFHGNNYFGVDAKKDSIDTISLVKYLAYKMGKESENPRSLAIADYGTGKSHFTVTLAVLLSGPEFMPETYNKVIDNIRVIDPESAAEITELCKDRNFVIVLNGIRDFNLHSEILKATQRSLHLYGIEDSELKKINRTIDTANRFFELNSKIHLADFEKAALSRGWRETGEKLVNKIGDLLGSDDDAFEIINDVYELITGQRIRWEEGISAKSILEMLLARYCGLNGQFDNVVILFDEFGRFLEYASGTDGGKCGDNALQEIFEVSQNAAGTLQVINFIQTDIKTYLLRVDQSRNLSRYIGRYDESEKYHISSNLETVFANLIARKDKIAFSDRIVAWQNKKESEWKDIFEKLNKWGQTSGIWANYTEFRKVIVEGIYPIHPVSVYMLTQLSDYLQNRSSMNLISQYISNVSEIDVDQVIPLVIPVELMKGDLFTEMIAAETSGRHRSDYCIRYENALKKNEQKLNKDQIAVLQANLVTRTLRFNTRNYEEAKSSLMICSGLSEKAVDDALAILVDEYAILAFDEMSGCFDFMEDAKGAYDYKIMKQRLISKQNIDLRSLFSTASILEIGGFTQVQQTNFGITHKILTNEWCFTQEVMCAEDMDIEIARKYISDWENAKSVVTPKGHLIWIYANKETDYHAIENVQNISKLFTGMPIVMLFLNDADNKVKNVLTEYFVLDQMDETTKKAYSTIYVKDRERVISNLRNVFESLKKNREQITSEGTNKWEKRFSLALSDIFENLYPNVVSFNFDGLLTSGNNFTGNGIKYYCQILKMLLSNKVNFDTIRDFPRDVRNRIETLFMVDNNNSWKCLTQDCAIISPLDEKARMINDIVVGALEKNSNFDCSAFFNMFCLPPYGLSEEAGAMLLATIMVNLWHNIRVEYNGIRKTVTEWKDEVVEDKKLHLDVFKSTSLLWVDTGSVEAKFQQLFTKINANRDLDTAKKLDADRLSMIEFLGLPESLDVHNRLAVMRFSQFSEAEGKWITQTDDIKAILWEANERVDIVKALNAVEMIKSVSIYDIFTKNNIDVSDAYNLELRGFLSQVDTIIRTHFTTWLATKVYCSSVDQMKKFENFYTRCCILLTQYGYKEFAKKLKEKGENEIANRAEIKSRQELVADGQKFIADCERVAKTNYLEIKELIRQSAELEIRFSKFGEGLGKEAIILSGKVRDAAEQLKRRKKSMDDDMASVYDIVYEAKSVDDIEQAYECLTKVLGYNIPDEDRADYRKLQKLLDELISDCREINAKSNNREAFEQFAEEMVTKYESVDIDYEFGTVISDSIAMARRKMDNRDEQWRVLNVTLGNKSRQEVYAWKQRIKELPPYLSDKTMKAITDLDIEADQLISDGKIEDVVFYYERLNNDEKKKCLEILKSK